jgi:hypothetical protein
MTFVGMFDYYVPVPELFCPLCGSTLFGWQGKDGPCGLYVWRQGTASPIEQAASDDCRLPAERIAECRLPEQLDIYPFCGYRLVTAECLLHGDVWTRRTLKEVKSRDHRGYWRPIWPERTG